MLRAHYVEAIETQLRWLRWGQSHGTQLLREQHGFTKIAETYEDILRTADTFCMERQFAGLIEEARLTVPDDLAFEHTWMQSKRGFLWIQEPVPRPGDRPPPPRRWRSASSRSVPVRIRAIGWREIPEGEWLVPLSGEPWLAPKGCVQFCMFADGRSFPISRSAT